MAFLGVIGGLGPMATAYYMELVTAMTDVPVDHSI
jgi:aspartate/glutamate racemase